MRPIRTRLARSEVCPVGHQPTHCWESRLPVGLRVASPVAEVATGGEGVWVVGTEDSKYVGEEGLERDGGAVGVAGYAPPVGEVAACVEGLWVVGAEDAEYIGEEGFERDGGAVGVAGYAPPAGEVA